jgi:hypothetical protein
VRAGLLPAITLLIPTGRWRRKIIWMTPFLGESGGDCTRVHRLTHHGRPAGLHTHIKQTNAPPCTHATQDVRAVRDREEDGTSVNGVHHDRVCSRAPGVVPYPVEADRHPPTADGLFPIKSNDIWVIKDNQGENLGFLQKTPDMIA